MWNLFVMSRRSEKQKKEGGKKGEGIRERRKGTAAIITPFCSPLRTLATANFDWLIKLAISVSLRRVVKHFPAERKITSMFTFRLSAIQDKIITVTENYPT